MPKNEDVTETYPKVKRPEEKPRIPKRYKRMGYTNNVVTIEGTEAYTLIMSPGTTKLYTREKHGTMRKVQIVDFKANGNKGYTAALVAFDGTNILLTVEIVRRGIKDKSGELVKNEDGTPKMISSTKASARVVKK